MPGRKVILANNEIYHIFNRGIASMPTFSNHKDYRRAIDAIFYYQNKTVPLRYAKFLKLPLNERSKLLEELRVKMNWWVEIICYCLMPNHFHLLLKQIENNGISKFVGNFANSYTRYFNTKQDRKGPIYEGKFKSVRIETEEQLLHVQRYIHLNPYSGYLIKRPEDLEKFSYSSFPEYVDKDKTGFCSKDLILSNFKNIGLFKEFVYNQADYQKKLVEIKHLLF
ncbi:hypothetical protein C4559_02420 [Candidatus Microgenomates bacterium]|nr:MAG: hypothetical protein C4559_02420 [Candidatus Microgenomates bacterium]